MMQVRHLLLDLRTVSSLSDQSELGALLRDAAEFAGAKVIHVKMHSFGPESGVTGFALLAESHISIHTWPEHNRALLDILMCGDADIQKAKKMIVDRLGAEVAREDIVTR